MRDGVGKKWGQQEEGREGELGLVCNKQTKDEDGKPLEKNIHEDYTYMYICLLVYVCAYTHLCIYRCIFLHVNI